MFLQPPSHWISLTRCALMSQPLVRAGVRAWGPRKTLFIFNCRVICCHSRYPSRLSPPSSSLFSHSCQLFPIHTKYLTLTSSSGTAESDTNKHKTTRESTKLAMELCFTHDCLECLLLQHVLTLLLRLFGCSLCKCSLLIVPFYQTFL